MPHTAKPSSPRPSADAGAPFNKRNTLFLPCLGWWYLFFVSFSFFSWSFLFAFDFPVYLKNGKDIPLLTFHAEINEKYSGPRRGSEGIEQPEKHEWGQWTPPPFMYAPRQFFVFCLQDFRSYFLAPRPTPLWPNHCVDVLNFPCPLLVLWPLYLYTYIFPYISVLPPLNQKKHIFYCSYCPAAAAVGRIGRRVVRAVATERGVDRCWRDRLRAAGHRRRQTAGSRIGLAHHHFHTTTRSRRSGERSQGRGGRTKRERRAEEFGRWASRAPPPRAIGGERTDQAAADGVGGSGPAPQGRRAEWHRRTGVTRRRRRMRPHQGQVAAGRRRAGREAQPVGVAQDATVLQRRPVSPARHRQQYPGDFAA